MRAGVDLVVAALPRDAEQFEVAGARVDIARGLNARGERLLWEQVGLPRVMRRVGADVLHSPHYTRPVRVSGASVVTLHDATFFSHPELHQRLKVLTFRAATRFAVRTAGALLVPSAATRDEVLRYAGGVPGRFHVAHHGVDRSVFHPSTPEAMLAVAQRLGLGGKPYIAFVGSLEPRKNVPALVRAWIDAASSMEHPPALVLAGAQGWDHAVDAALTAVPERMQVVVPGYLPVEEMAPFLAGAQVVAYPSLGEGFGLPVLEAMASGACVLTTRELSLPEVGGDAVEYSGTSATQIAAVLAGLLAAPERRRELADKALARAASFTWDACARAHVIAYESAVQADVRTT